MMTAAMCGILFSELMGRVVQIQVVIQKPVMHDQKHDCVFESGGLAKAMSFDDINDHTIVEQNDRPQLNGCSRDFDPAANS